MADEKSSGPGSASTDRLETLQSRVAETERLARDVADLRRQGKWVRLGYVLVVLLMLTVFGILFYRMGATFDKAGFLATLQMDMATNFLPKVRATALQTLQNVRPVYEKTFREKAEKVLPELGKKFQPEVESLYENARKVTQTELNAGMKRILGKQEAKLQEHFPELKDPEKLDAAVKNLNLAISAAAGDLLVTRLMKASDALERVHKTMMRMLPEDKRAWEKMRQDRRAQMWDHFLKWGKVAPLLKEPDVR